MREGVLEAAPYDGANELYRRGRLRVAESRRTLEHSDGTPYFWLGDTWWYGLSPRLAWPDGFRKLVADRKHKGFNTIQLVVGLFPEYEGDAIWSPATANEAGWPWEKDWKRMCPEYFDLADLRIAFLVEQGVVPVIVPMWGYFVMMMGEKKAKQHWRYLVARYGAYPVVWMMAGEVEAPVYSTPREERRKISAEQVKIWTDITRYVRQIDPWNNIVTTHPEAEARKVVIDESVLDFNILQTGHNGAFAYEHMVTKLSAALARRPIMPTMMNEVSYEGISGSNHSDVQRFSFWASVTTSSCGFTYGAQGVWGMVTPDTPSVGVAVTDYCNRAGEVFWEDAMRLPGSAQVGLGGQFFQRYPWHLFQPVEMPDKAKEGRVGLFATGIPGAVKIFYLPSRRLPSQLIGARDQESHGFREVVPIPIEPGSNYRYFYFNPRNGDEVIPGVVKPENGFWRPPQPPSCSDWVLVLEDKEKLAGIS